MNFLVNHGFQLPGMYISSLIIILAKDWCLSKCLLGFDPSGLTLQLQLCKRNLRICGNLWMLQRWPTGLIKTSSSLQNLV